MVSGSGRSIQGFNLLAALQACDDVFDRYGGHQAAAGFSCPRDRLDELIERFQLAVRETLPPERLEPILWIDGYLKPETICYDFARSLERLAPFGAGFQYPTFAARDLRLTESRQLGAEGQHWRARFRAFDSVPVEAIFFDHGQLAEQFHVGDSAGRRVPPEAHPLGRLLAARDGAPRRSDGMIVNQFFWKSKVCGLSPQGSAPWTPQMHVLHPVAEAFLPRPGQRHVQCHTFLRASW